MHWEQDNKERAEFFRFVENITIRAGHATIRYYLKCMHPELLDDETWINSLLDVWMYRYQENKETK